MKQAPIKPTAQTAETPTLIQKDTGLVARKNFSFTGPSKRHATVGQRDNDLYSEDQAQQGREDLHENHAIFFWIVIVYCVNRIQAKPSDLALAPPGRVGEISFQGLESPSAP